jgi:Trk K+ transport system NAD-binding subunit
VYGQIEGCNGVGRHVAHRLIADGETVDRRAR